MKKLFRNILIGLKIPVTQNIISHYNESENYYFVAAPKAAV